MRQAARIANGKLCGKAVLLDDPRALLRARQAERKAKRRQARQRDGQAEQAGLARLQRKALQATTRRTGAVTALAPESPSATARAAARSILRNGMLHGRWRAAARSRAHCPYHAVLAGFAV